MHLLLQRLLRRGPRYGISRGVAMFGPQRTHVAPATWDIPRPSPEFAAWAGSQGAPLDGSPDSLATLDGVVDTWRESEHGPALGNELGLYLGHVLVGTVPGATWTEWPNGHPVVRVPSGAELDVLDLVHRRLDGGGTALPAVLEMARQT